LNSKFAAVIFDMDGTLVDSEIIWREAEIDFFRALNIEYSDDHRAMIVGMRLDQMFTTLKDLYKLTHTTQELSAGLVELMIPLIHSKVQQKPGAQELVEYVASMKLPYAIASSSPMSVITATVTAQKWETLIPHLYTADDVKFGKPAPDVYLFAAEKLGVKPSECLAIEDSPNGARAAVAAGMTCYAVPDFHSNPEVMREITPHVFGSLHEVLEVLRSEGQTG
jgi:HAD superfamily hydrolase (TIGR01509 family)